GSGLAELALLDAIEQPFPDRPVPDVLADLAGGDVLDGPLLLLVSYPQSRPHAKLALHQDVLLTQLPDAFLDALGGQSPVSVGGAALWQLLAGPAQPEGEIADAVVELAQPMLGEVVNQQRLEPGESAIGDQFAELSGQHAARIDLEESLGDP